MSGGLCGWGGPHNPWGGTLGRAPFRVGRRARPACGENQGGVRSAAAGRDWAPLPVYRGPPSEVAGGDGRRDGAGTYYRPPRYPPPRLCYRAPSPLSIACLASRI